MEETSDLQEQLDKTMKQYNAIQDFLETHRDTLPRIVLDVLESTWSQLIEDLYAFEYSMAEYQQKLSKLQKDIGETNS